MQEIERLKDDNDRQQKLLSVNLTKSPQTQTEAFMQHEITRLTSENLVSRQSRMCVLVKILAQSVSDMHFV
jgi:myosin-5